MTSLLFRIFAPFQTPKKLFSFTGIIVLLSLGIGTFLGIQILLSNYKDSIVAKVLEAKEEIVVVRDPIQNKKASVEKKSLRERTRIRRDEEVSLSEKIRNVLPGSAVSPFLKRNDISFTYKKDGHSYTLHVDLLIGVDFDKNMTVLPLMDQIGVVERKEFRNPSTATIPILISESLVVDEDVRNQSFEFSLGDRYFTIKVVGILKQNKLFPIPVGVVPLECAKKMFAVNESDGLGVRVFNHPRSLDLSEKLSVSLGNEFVVQHWSESLGAIDGIFMAVNVIISLVVSSLFALAFLFAVSTFDMMMKRKKKQLALLLALGMPPKAIRSGLFRVAFFVGVICYGLGIGISYVFLMIAPCSLLSPIFEQMMLDDFSFRVSWEMLVFVSVIALVVPFASAWITSKRAFRIDPIEDLRK